MRPDILDRLRTIRDAGGDRVDPLWLELAIVEIERLRLLIDSAETVLDMIRAGK
jgi:hypothetical protein